MKRSILLAGLVALCAGAALVANAIAANSPRAAAACTPGVHKIGGVGVTARAKAGVQTQQAVAVVHAGKSKALIGTVTLKAGLKSGTFSGKVFGSQTKISGSFTC